MIRIMMRRWKAIISISIIIVDFVSVGDGVTDKSNFEVSGLRP